jgi:hypothetical protein
MNSEQLAQELYALCQDKTLGSEQIVAELTVKVGWFPKHGEPVALVRQYKQSNTNLLEIGKQIYNCYHEGDEPVSDGFNVSGTDDPYLKVKTYFDTALNRCPKERKVIKAFTEPLKALAAYKYIEGQMKDATPDHVIDLEKFYQDSVSKDVYTYEEYGEVTIYTKDELLDAAIDQRAEYYMNCAHEIAVSDVSDDEQSDNWNGIAESAGLGGQKEIDGFRVCEDY